MSKTCVHGFLNGPDHAPCSWCKDDRISELESALAERERECEEKEFINGQILVQLKVARGAHKRAEIDMFTAIGRADSAEAALAAAREENERPREAYDSQEVQFVHTQASYLQAYEDLKSELAALRAHDEGRVERVAEELKRQFTVGVGQVQWWLARARAVLEAADGREP